MKKLIYIIVIAGMLPFLSGCENFLDTQSYTQKTTENFPKTDEDVTQMLTGVYSILNEMTADPLSTNFGINELCADYRFGGGGMDNIDMQSIHHLLYSNPNQFEGLWTERYKGIARANDVINAMGTVKGLSNTKQKMGEAKFLRAFFYLDLVQILGNVPLLTSTPDNVQEAQVSPPQAKQEDIYAQIGGDLWDAYSTMPNTKWNAVPSGTVTKWAAAGLLARVFLFYTGFYDQKTLPIVSAEDSKKKEVTKDDVIAALEDCMNKSGHKLVSDFRSLWPYTNTFTKPDYPYAKGAQDWVQDATNPEQVFVVKYSKAGNWTDSGDNGFGNDYCCYCGIRTGGSGNQDYTKVFPISQGYGMGPVNTNFWNQWAKDEPTDLRRQASIWNQADESTGYAWGGDSQMEETGFWQKKITGITCYNGEDLLWTFTSLLYGPVSGDDWQLGSATDMCLIRYADILLMHDELTGTNDGMTQLRARAGLGEVPYTLANLQKERLHELAFEGLRWNDLRRWHLAEQPGYLDNMYGVTIRNNAIVTTMHQQGPDNIVDRYKATKGFFAIPLTEITLANGVLKQNDGWNSAYLFNAWK